ncbi:MAG: hypothetical protein Q9164_001463 [Protoblastenia rupestris]
MMDGVIEQWRAEIQPGSPTSLDFVDIPLDTPATCHEETVNSLDTGKTTTDYDRNSPAIFDVTKAQLILEDEDVRFNAQHNVQPGFFNELELSEEFLDFSGVHTAAQTEETSIEQIDLPNEDITSQNLGLPIDTLSSATLAEEIERINTDMPDLSNLSGQPSSTTLGEVSPGGQHVQLSAHSFRGQGGSEPSASSSLDCKARRQLPRLVIPMSADRKTSLLNGTPFEIGSADSTSTGISFCISALEAGTMSPHSPQLCQSKAAIGCHITTEAPPDSCAGIIEVPIPVFPYAHLTTRCRERDCPIWIQHEKGPYIHEGKLRMREGTIFGASNPPPRIWQAYDRIKVGKSVPKKDALLVSSFVKYHFGFSDKGDLEERGSPVESSSGSVASSSRAGGLIGVLERFGALRRRKYY